MLYRFFVEDCSYIIFTDALFEPKSIFYDYYYLHLQTKPFINQAIYSLVKKKKNQ